VPNPPAVLIRLINATGRGHVEWHETDPYVYETKLGEATVRISSRDRDGVAPYELQVISQGKATVTVTGNTEDRQYNEAFKELYATAAGSSVDTSPAVSEVLAELERLDEPPF
jgi:hypothetical protein